MLKKGLCCLLEWSCLHGAVGSFQDFCEKAAGGVSSQRDPALPREQTLRSPAIRCSENVSPARDCSFLSEQALSLQY